LCLVWYGTVSLVVTGMWCLQNVCKYLHKHTSHLRRAESFLFYVFVCLYANIKHTYTSLYFCVVLIKLLPKPKIQTVDQTSRSIIIWRYHLLGAQHGVTAPDAPHRSSLQEATTTKTAWWQTVC
jgi:hypothetical protein